MKIAKDKQDVQTSKARPVSLGTKLLLMAGGMAAACVLLVLLLLLFPDLIPARLRAGSYVRPNAGITLHVEYKLSDGDLFAWLPGKVRPPKEDAVLESFTLAWGADGFRVPARTADHYPIAAFGDSFTEAADVPTPWTDRLAEKLNTPVRNYGYRGYGPLETAKAAADFAGSEPRTWLLYAFFAGNDLSEANRTTPLEAGSPLDLWPNLVRQVSGATPVPTPIPSDHYDFPLPVIIGGNYYDMGFLPYYMWWQIAPPQGFAASRSFQSVGNTMDTMSQAVSPNTCRALIFIPTKDQLYYPYIYATDHQWIRSVGQTTYIDDQGRLQLHDHPFSDAEEASLIASLTGQRDAIAQLVASKPGWHFIDLLPPFEQAVAKGELLYYQYDTHWNQAGHDLAAQVIADSLRAVPGCPLNP